MELTNNNSGEVSALSGAIKLLNETSSTFYQSFFRSDIKTMIDSLETWHSLLLGFDNINLEKVKVIGDKIREIKKEVLKNANIIVGTRGTYFYSFKNPTPHIDKLMNICQELKIIEREAGLYTVKTKENQERLKE